MSSLLAAGRLLVHASCEGLLTELPDHSWDPAATERGEDAPLNADGRSADALRYVVHSTAHESRHLLTAWCDMDADDEDTVLLSDVLPRRGNSLSYTYDLGDCWQHEITCQKILSGGPSTNHPVCTAGHGESPVEDSTPEHEGAPYPTTPFLIDTVNERLSRLFSSSS